MLAADGGTIASVILVPMHALGINHQYVTLIIIAVGVILISNT